MEYGSRIRFISFIVGGLLLLVLSLWGITALARNLIGSGSKDATTQVKKIDLAEYTKPSTFVRLTLEGPIVSNEKYQSYQIEVGQDYREIKIFSGYNKTVISQQRYTNNATAYEAFLKSLKQANYTSTVKGASDNETGYCATGNRYVYELYEGTTQKLRTWSSTCTGTVTSTFAGLSTTVRTLFKKQIPDIDKLTAKISL